MQDDGAPLQADGFERHQSHHPFLRGVEVDGYFVDHELDAQFFEAQQLFRSFPAQIIPFLVEFPCIGLIEGVECVARGMVGEMQTSDRRFGPRTQGVQEAVECAEVLECERGLAIKQWGCLFVDLLTGQEESGGPRRQLEGWNEFFALDPAWPVIKSTTAADIRLQVWLHVSRTVGTTICQRSFCLIGEANFEEFGLESVCIYFVADLSRQVQKLGRFF